MIEQLFSLSNFPNLDVDSQESFQLHKNLEIKIANEMN